MRYEKYDGAQSKVVVSWVESDGGVGDSEYLFRDYGSPCLPFYGPLFVFGSEDATFVGKSWNEIVAFSPDLGFWIVLTMVSMCAMMMGWGVLTVGVAKNAYQRGERWAWRTLVGANVFMVVYYVGILIPFASRGLYGTSAAFPSGVSLGVPMLVIFTAWPIVGLWLPRKELIE